MKYFQFFVIALLLLVMVSFSGCAGDNVPPKSPPVEELIVPELPEDQTQQPEPQDTIVPETFEPFSNPEFIENYKFKIDGKEQLVFGWYHNIGREHNLETLGKTNINMLMPYSLVWYDKRSIKRTDDYLVEANNYGLKILIEIDRELLKNEDYEGITEQVNHFKSFPAVYGWYIADEPVHHQEQKGTYYDVMEEIYKIIRKNDPYKPVFMAVVGLSVKRGLNKYINTYDVLMVDSYPCKHNEPIFGVGFENFTEYVEWPVPYVKENNKSAFIMITQAFGKNEKYPEEHWVNAGNSRYPTYEESRYMSYLPIINGATGLFYFAYSYAEVNEEWLQGVGYKIFDELKALEHIILSESKDALVSCGTCENISYMVRKNPSQNGTYYIFAANTKKETAQATFTFAGTSGISNIEAVYENGRSLTASGNSFTDSFKEYDVHVYKLS